MAQTPVTTSPDLIKRFSPTKKAQVILVGAYHMANPGQDLVKTIVDDHLSPKRQREIDDVLDRLESLKPTRVLVEWPVGKDGLDRWYDDFRSGKTVPKIANETEQIGFKLAMRMGHSKVYAVDHRLDMDFDRLFRFAQERKLDQAMAGFMAVTQSIGEQQAAAMKAMTVRQLLYEANRPETVAFTQGIYLRLLDFAVGQDQPGADVLSDWYRRNLKIVASIREIAKPEDRIVVLMGASHTAILQRLLADSLDFELIDVSAFLKS